MRGEKLTPRIVWQNEKPTIITDEAKYMYVLFDDTVLDKRHAKIEMAQRQYNRYYCES
uniref:hypothetical protein n=1 Tax=Pseudanabaena yagii TaxID=2661615 RepID=UPI001CECD051|nr:hypothetical protein [Pseudanabaena yagii]